MSPSNPNNEPIAIVGMACRFSGTATSPDSLWDMLSKGSTGWTKTASHRFNLNAFLHPKGDNKGTFNAKGFHLLKQDPAVFDNDFFGISGLEAKAMDPQQRLLLEVAYEAFENAGQSMEELKGSQTGVWCSVSNADYESILARDPDVSPNYRMTGAGNAIVSNRISYFFDLRGPSMTIDTFCSSTLVGLDAAVKSIRAGVVTEALVGGSNLCLDPERTAVLSSMSFTSPDGRCYAFDPRASGYGRGEGVAAVILKPLSLALADGSPIRAVIRGTGVSSDGRTNGITLPSTWGQKQALQMAYQDAGLNPRDTYFVEAHGTGTKAGDRTEAIVWMDTFLRERPKDMPLVVGSVKGNLGHTEPTAGLAGLLKAVLILEKGVIPSTPTHKSLSPDIADVLGDSFVQIATKNCAWPEGITRRISVNTTGYGGTDAHVVIEHLDETLAETSTSTDDCIADDRPRVFALSHRRAEALKETAQSLHRLLSQKWALNREGLLNDLAFTLSRRSHLDYRMSFAASTLPQVLDKLDAIAKGVNRVDAAGSSPAICFAFTGQGAQWPQMGLDLMPQYTVFAASMRQSEAEFVSLGAKWRLIEELQKPKLESSINQAWLSQPCCTAVQIAVLDLLSTWGIEPQVVCGHSSGEIAAAYAAGVLTAKEALKVAYYRGFHVEALRQSRPDLKGAMLAVGVSADGALRYVEPADKVTVACYNSPQSATLSGDAEGVLQVKARLDAEAIFARKLDVDVAYHSAHMKLVEPSYLAALHDICPKPCKEGVRMYSSVTEELLDGTEMGASYWTANLISPVRFSQALTKVLETRTSWIAPGTSGTTLITEIGPHAALKGPITQVVKAAASQGQTIYHSSLRRGEDGPTSLLELAGKTHERGSSVLFATINNPDFNSARPKLLVNLPKYLWNRDKSHWAESRRSAAYRFRAVPSHDILGSPTMDSLQAEPTWRVYLRQSAIPWVTGHVLQRQVVLPGAAYLSMIVEALKAQFLSQKRRWKGLTIHFRDVRFVRVLLVPDAEIGTETIISLRFSSESTTDPAASWYEFRVFTADGPTSNEHCRGMVSVSPSAIASAVPSHAEPDAMTELASASLYEALESVGAQYTGHAAQLTEIQGGQGFARCAFRIPDTNATMPEKTEQPCVVHPLTLEAAFQTPFAALKLDKMLETIYLLDGVDDLYISTDIPSTPDTVLSTKTEVEPFGILKAKASVTVTHPGQPSDGIYIRANGIRYAGLEREDAVPEGLEEESLCHYVDWILDPFRSSSDALVRWISKVAKETAPISSKLDSLGELDHKAASKPVDRAAYDHQYQAIHVCLELWKGSFDKDTTPEMSLALQEKLLAQGPLGKSIFEVLTAHNQRVKGLGSDIFTPSVTPPELTYEDGTIKPFLHNVASYLRILRLKRPSLRILALDAELGTLKPLVEAVLFSSRRAQNLKDDDCQLTYAELASSKGVSPSNSDCLQLDLHRALEDQSIELGQFDLVLVPSGLGLLVPEMSEALPRLRTLIRDEGALVSVEPSSRLGPANELEKTILQSGFDDLCTVPESTDGTGMWIARSLRKTSITSNSVQVIAPEGVEDIVQHLSSRMTANDVKISATTVSQAIPGAGTFIVLLELAKPFLKSQSSAEWQKLQEILTKASHVLWVTNQGAFEAIDPNRSLISGFARSLRVEFPELQLVTLDIESTSTSRVAQGIYDIYSTHLDSHTSKAVEAEWEFAQRGDAVFVQRAFNHQTGSAYIEDSTSSYHPRMATLGSEPGSLGLNIRTAGVLDSLYWADMAVHSRSVGPQEIRLTMQNFATNDLDARTIIGESASFSTLLTEGVGVVVDIGSQVKDFALDDVVYAFEPTGLAITSNISAQSAVKMPPGTNGAEGVTVPLAYGTALFCLRNTAHLQCGETILIHFAASSVGQAAIAMARYLGAGDILVTASTVDERELLEKRCGIPLSNIFATTDLGNASEVINRSHAQGIDVLLNCASTTAPSNLCGVLADFGRMIDVGVQDARRTTRLETKVLAKNASYITVDMAFLSRAKPALLKEVFTTALSLVNDAKVLLPHDITTYPLAEAKEALDSSRPGHKVLLVSADASLPTQPARPVPTSLRSDASYLVVGGTGGLGRVITRYLVQLGATRIITLSRSGNDKVEAQQLTAELARLGVELENVKGTAVDVSTIKRIAQESGVRPVRGVVHAGAVFEESIDGPFETTTYEQWKRGTEVKIEGTINLYEVFGPSADFFTMLSSVVGVQGTYGQIAYDTGNAFQDAFARSCAARGLPARSLDLSMVAGEGQGAQDEAVAFLQRHGLRKIDLETVTAAIGFSISHPIAPTAAEGQILVGFRQEHPESGSKIAALQRSDARFAHIWFKPIGSSMTAVKEGEFNVQGSLRDATTAEEAAEAAFTGLRGLVSQLLDVDQASVLPDRNVISYGLDSLTAMELRKYVQTTLASAVQMLEIMNPMPLMEFARLVAGRSALVKDDLFPKK